MVNDGALKSAAKDIGIYALITFSTYFTVMLVHVILGFFDEKVLPALGLNASGTAYLAISGLITAVGTALNTIVGIVTVIVGLLTLIIVLKVFGFNINFNMGGGRV